MPAGPPRAGHDGGILVRLTGRGGRSRTGPPRSGGRYGLLLLVLIRTYLLSAFNGRNLATESQIGLFAVILLLALRTIQSIYGALSAYMIIGLMFAACYSPPAT